jgi:hypothetical protein
MRWFLTNLVILLGLDWLAACASFALGGDELHTTLGETVGLVALGLFGVGEMLLLTLPGFLLYLGVLSRRRTRRAAWKLSPLLLTATWWTYIFAWQIAVPATLCIPLAARLVRVEPPRPA